MRRFLSGLAVAGGGLVLASCATTGDQYASACERDYARNQEYATASGAALGALVGAAIDDQNRDRGAAIGALAGGLIGNQLSADDDPCGYGFAGYNRDGRYGHKRIYWRERDRGY